MTASHDASPHGFRNSVLLHVGVIAALIGYGYWSEMARDRFGDPNSLGASAGVSAVSQIPLPRREGRINRIANDTDSQVAPPEKTEKKPAEKQEDPDAIPLKKREKKSKQEVIASKQKYREDPIVPNQVTSTLGRAAVSPLIGAPGSGGVGAAASSPFGNRFGWYEKLIRERVAQRWNTQDVDMRLRTAPTCIITFAIAKDGNISNVKIIQSSGNYALDQSVERAVRDSNPMPPLPQGFEKNSANIEFWFELKR
ncbi:MAG: energy transducer TonB [Acidobacteria bacterium]|nr:energy transducer TonB [Acidobacteriota bacterium]